MRTKVLAAVLGVAVASVALAGEAAAHSEKTRRLTFPNAADGALVLPVDLHTHSVFSDGSVWPNIRVEEAQRDGLAVMAVTEHLEYQPHAKDIPHPDRNRSYNLAKAAAKKDLLVINGAEITRDMPPGHVNAVFLSDANALRVAEPEAAIKAANDQGAFVFWNHPYWTAQRPTGTAALTDMHRRLIAAKQLHGIEVANGADYSETALTIAIENNLTILGTSDVHGLVDWDYDVAGGGQRTVTLVLAEKNDAESVKAALRAGRTVAYYKRQLIGRKQNVEAVVRGALRMETLAPEKAGLKVTRIRLVNSAPTPFTLRNVGAQSFYDASHIVTVPANGALDVMLTEAPDPAAVALDVEVLNAITAPDTHLRLWLKP